MINEKQAKIVRRIYRDFLDGKGANRITRELERDRVPNWHGKAKWYESSIRKMLTNEKYMGDALLQKTYTVDFLNKKRAENTGQVPQYYVEDSHEGIITKEDFSAVQAEFARRNSLRGYSKTGRSEYSSKYPFSGKLYCNICSGKFNRQIWGVGKYKKGVWICSNHRMNGVKACTQKAVVEYKLEQAFLRAVNQVIGDKSVFFDRLFDNIYEGIDVVENEFTKEQINERLTELQQEIMSLVRLNAKTGLETGAYDEEYSQLTAEIERFRGLRQKLLDEETQKVIRTNRIDELRKFIQDQGTALEHFDGDIFRRLIEKVSVKAIVEAVFVFKTGIEVRQELG